MATPSANIVNQALQLTGNNAPPVTGGAPNFDDSAAGQAAALLYVPAARALLREFAWDFARNTIALVLSGNVAPTPWALEYKWPDNAIQIWQILPAVNDPFDPLPINYTIANAIVDATRQRVIQTDEPNALVVFNNYPSETVWDDSFVAAMIRVLASPLAMAISGKPDVAQEMLQEGSAFTQIAMGRQD